MDIAVCITQQAEADALLGRNPLALLIGAVLDRHVPSELAYAAPVVIARRLGEGLDVHRLAQYDPRQLATIFKVRPAVHEFPALMARRVQELCHHLVALHDGRAAAVWEGAGTGKELYSRLHALPGFGRQKTQIFVALLGKQYGIRPDGWREAAGPYGEAGVHRSVADVTDPHSLAKVHAARAEERRSARTAQARRAASLRAEERSEQAHRTASRLGHRAT
ncbi:HhH-GPD-type base excision DNA repair protein [Kitasatospora sp. NPDC054768]